MKVCVLLAAATMTAAKPQTAATEDATTLSADPSPATDPSLAADPSPATDPAPGATATKPSASPTTAPAATGATPLNPSFFGPGLNNQAAIPVNPMVVQHANKVLATHPHLRVFVDVDGTARFTDIYGREVEEVLDQFGHDLAELLDVQEQQELLLQNQQQQQQLQMVRKGEFDRRRKQLELKLLQEFQSNPAAFDPPAGAGASGIGAEGQA
ncbi:putative gastrolith protein 18.2-like 2 [Homarus americanus]|uniref:Putative gastrolith protein 18.2-like 2 n=1 Tax=Homarus americanus TaxID=6706 RepID=A0A8J5JVU3_HOMAM|nr:putative gastrolith protein 18.2-like 2 [Homarus americanus]